VFVATQELVRAAEEQDDADVR